MSGLATSDAAIHRAQTAAALVLGWEARGESRALAVCSE